MAKKTEMKPKKSEVQKDNTASARSSLSQDENARSLAMGPDVTQYLTAYLADQCFGVNIQQVEEVIEDMSLTRVPLASTEVAGIMNLRGRVVTAIHLDRFLGIARKAQTDSTPEDKQQIIVFNFEGELYSLIVDRVGDVLGLSDYSLKSPPSNLDEKWLGVTSGIYRMESQLLLILDIKRIMQRLIPETAAEAA